MYLDCIRAADESVLTVEQLATRFNVSTKTISRWRRLGLVGQRFFTEGHKRIGFPESTVRHFLERNGDRVRRSGQFSRLTREERATIVEQARCLAQTGRRPSDVARRLAGQTGRSAETIRYTLQRFDREHPDQAVFAEPSGPLSTETKRRIYHQHHRGEAIPSLARRFRRSQATIDRIIKEMRAQRIAGLPLEFVPHESFAKIKSRPAKQRIVGPAPRDESMHRKVRAPAGLPPYLASLYEVPLLTAEQETHLFRKMNYLKYRANRLRQRLDPQRPNAALMDRIERYYTEAVAVKNEIVRANLRLVVSIAKRHIAPGTEFFELVSDGNMSLMRAADRFDFSRGFKFSTYATWAIRKNFSRSIPDGRRYHDRFRTSLGEMFPAREDDRSDPVEQEATQSLRERQVERILDRLDLRERQIILRHFGLQQGEEPLTLKQIGAELGVSKERIRQLEARALAKLREAAEMERIESPV